MSTSYEEVYDRFLNKIEDYDFMNAIQDDEDFFDAKLLKHINSGISLFTYSVKGFIRDNKTLKFEREIDEQEKEIIALFMLHEYLNSKIIRDELVEQALGSRDFRQWSPANLLRAVKETQKEIKESADALMNVHYFSEGDL